MIRLLKDPLIHFLLIGALLFAFSAWRGESVRVGRTPIVITAAQVAQARDAAAVLQGGSVSRDELAKLIEPTIREEVLYREALARGLDENDDEVRRRLVEKMSYLTEDLADPAPASEDELRAFYAAEPVRFTVPQLVSFEQVFFSPQTRGAAVQADATAGLAALRGGRAPAEVGDRTPLRDAYDGVPRDQVEVLFGDAVAGALFTRAPDEWLGPFQSDFGQHDVRIKSRSAAHLPPFDEIRAQVLTEFGADRRRRQNAEQYARMRANYDVVIEWPDDNATATPAAPVSTPTPTPTPTPTSTPTPTPAAAAP